MFGKSTPIAQQQQTPTVGTVDDFLRSYGDFDDNLFGNGGWMDFFSAWNSAQGGNNYFGNMCGNQWKPADGLQVNSSNGNVGDWLGVASTVTNTLSNWGKEDPSLGRGGGYSQFGMATYDLMKGIRDMTKSEAWYSYICKRWKTFCGWWKCRSFGLCTNRYSCIKAC